MIKEFIALGMLIFVIQLSADCHAQTQVSDQVKVVNGQNKIDPADMEVIANLDILQNWDIVGPQGPNMDDLKTLNTKPVIGASHDK